MVTRLKDKVAVITGGASGIGAATAERFVTEGARVVIADIADERGHALARDLGDATRFVRADVSVEEDVAALVESAVHDFGRLDIMFNNAAVVGVVSSIAEMPIDGFDRTIAVGLRSAVAGMKHAARVMIPQHSGVILSTASIAALRGYGPHAYTAAKAGVVGLTRSVASELWPHNIRVNAILPGNTDTRQRAQMAKSPEAPERDAEQRRLMRDMDATEIASAAVYLASDESTFVTGEALVIDGGLTRAGDPSSLTRGRSTGIFELGPPT